MYTQRNEQQSQFIIVQQKVSAAVRSAIMYLNILIYFYNDRGCYSLFDFSGNLLVLFNGNCVIHCLLCMYGSGNCVVKVMALYNL